MKGSPRTRILSYVVIIYMLLAFSWWSILLYVKNNDAFQAKATYLELIKIGSKQIASEEEFYLSQEYQDLKAKYKRQERMIFGEAMVFILSLMAGIWLINRGYQNEVQLARQKRNFLLSVTHELKSPLASIRLILETFQKRELTNEQKQQLGENGIKENDRLSNLVNNLLTATRMETLYKPEREVIDIQDVLDSEVKRIRNLYPKRNIRFTKQNDQFQVNLDPSGFISILTNLVENALKYSEINEPVEILLTKSNNEAILKVSDRGIGIPPDEKQNIFSQFYRIGNEDTRKTKGTGLGLYIVKQIVQAHGGKISITENIPKGSIFEVRLPIN